MSPIELACTDISIASQNDVVHADLSTCVELARIDISVASWVDLTTHMELAHVDLVAWANLPC
jgi:hypothetical protein